MSEGGRSQGDISRPVGWAINPSSLPPVHWGLFGSVVPTKEPGSRGEDGTRPGLSQRSRLYGDLIDRSGHRLSSLALTTSSTLQIGLPCAHGRLHA